MDADVFSITIGKSLIYNSDFNESYDHFRIIELILENNGYKELLF